MIQQLGAAAQIQWCNVHLQIREHRVFISRGINLLKNDFSAVHADTAESEG